MKIFTWASILFVATLLAFSGCSKSKNGDAGAEGEIVDYTSLRAEVVRRVQGGDIKPDDTGMAALPENLKIASADGRIYASVSPINGQLIAFKSMAGKNFGEGLLYVEKPIASNTRDIQVGSFVLLIKGQVNEHWYRVGG